MQPMLSTLRIWPCLLVFLGCGEATFTESTMMAPAADMATYESAPGSSSVSRFATMAPGDEAVPAESATMPEVDSAFPRKIIYNAQVGLVVEDFASADKQISQIVNQFQGYIAEMEVLGSPGQKRSARWKVRVPVEAFESFLQDVLALGEVEKNSRTSEDVTERFYDLQARIKNKEVQEQRLQQILEERTGVLEDVLKVEQELSRVRGELEQMEGAIRLLENLSSLTKVTIPIRERTDFRPPPPVAASFGTRVSRAFHDSLGSLIALGESIALALVSLSVWLPVILLLVLPLWIVLRRWLRNRPWVRQTT
ncbi:hypothetical protein BH23PLA1_BH23PLA1_32980 [soil metagenome]